MVDHYDVVIVGAGPAGSTAGYFLAKAGLNVVIIERGKTPGSKNVSGGLLYSQPISGIFPEFWKDAPLERAITGHQIVLLGKDTSSALDFRSHSAGSPPYNCFSVLRSRFDPWLAKKAEDAGALLVPGISVDSLLIEDGKVIGVQAGQDKLEANITIIADGSRSLLLKQSALREGFSAQDVSLGIKEIILLSPNVLEERFQCSSSTGMAYTLVGSTNGVEGGGFIYTNKESLSVGVVVKIRSLAKSKMQPHQVLDAFKSHPFVSRLVEGGKIAEYSAQIVHRGGYQATAKLFGDGFITIGSAARLLLNNVVTLRGMDFAVISANVAAKVVQQASSRGDFGSKSLSSYEANLKGTAIYQDWSTFKDVYALMDNQRLFDVYPDLLGGVMEDLFTPSSEPAEKPFRNLRKKMSRKVSMLDLARDAWQAGKGILF